MLASSGDLAPLAVIAAVHWAAMVIPGPNVAVVLAAARSTNRRRALETAAGVAAGAAVWATAAVLGAASLVNAAPAATGVLQFAGGVYLIYLAVRVWRSRQTTVLSVRGARAALGTGLIVNLSNPKSLAFFTGVFVATLPSDATPWMRAAAIAVIVADASLWHAALALAAGRWAPRRGRVALDQLAATFIALIGGGFMFDAVRGGA